MISIIVAIITSVGTIVGVVITNMGSNRKIEIQLDKKQAVTDTKIEELTREVRLHNNFAQRVPVLEEQIIRINDRIDSLEELHRR